MFTARDNDMGMVAKKKSGLKPYTGYDKTDKEQADMEKGITPKKRKE